MQLSVSQLLNTEPKKVSTKQKEFSKLWKRIAALKKSNATFEQKLHKLVEQVAPILKNYEANSVAVMHQLIEKKIHFLGMKSLGRYNRDALSEWIEDSFQVIQAMQPEASDLFKSQVKLYNQTLARFYDLDEQPEDHHSAFSIEPDNDDDIPESLDELFEQLAQQFQAQQALDREEFLDSLNNQQQSLLDDADKIAAFDELQRQELEHEMEQMKAQFNEMKVSLDDDEFAADDDFDFNFDNEHANFSQEPPSSQKSDKLRQLLDGANISKMFRRIARALHPDREQDPEQQLIKQTLMAQAIQARDDGDIITIFDMYATYVDNSELYFDDAQLDSINTLLKEQIKQLQHDKQKIIQATPRSYQCYEMFYAGSANKIALKVKLFEKDSKQEMADLKGLASALKNLKIMKQVIDERNFSHFDNPYF